MNMSIGFLYGSFSITYLLKEVLTLAFSLLKSIGIGTSKYIMLMVRILIRPIKLFLSLTNPHGKPNKFLILLAITFFLWLWIKRLEWYKTKLSN